MPHLHLQRPSLVALWPARLHALRSRLSPLRRAQSPFRDKRRHAMKKWNYYNDNDPQVCEWARQLIGAKLVADGEVDCRSITDIDPKELEDFVQCHFFCGILGWPLALQLAGWPGDRPVWTGSCPCQPFSGAGKRHGAADQRHLWPDFYALVAQCRPATLFGEQVAGDLGREWLAGVRLDLEDLGYACGIADLCAAAVGAPHRRSRLYWAAHSRGGSQWSQPEQGEPARNGRSELEGSRLSIGLAHSQHPERRPQHDPGEHGRHRQDGGWPEAHRLPGTCGEIRGPGHTQNAGLPQREVSSSRAGQAMVSVERQSPEQAGSGPDHAPGHGRQVRSFLHPEHDGQGPDQGCEPGGLEDSAGNGSPSGIPKSESGEKGRPEVSNDRGNFWSDALRHECRDGKARRISPQPALFPLADGLPGRVGLLRGSGNAIVPQLAAVFIRAAAEALNL